MSCREHRPCFTHTTRTSPSPDDFPRPDGIGARALAEKRRVISYEEPDISIHPEKVAAGARAMCCYPLIAAGDALGALYVYLHEDQKFKTIELLILDNFVNQAAMVLFLARQLVATEQERIRKERELNHLHRAGLLLSTPTGVHETLETILQMALEVIDAQYGIFRLVDQSNNQLVTAAFLGEGLDHPALEPLSLAEPSVMGLAATRQEPLLIADLHQEEYRQIYVPLDSGMEMRSELVVPLIGASGRIEGVLNLESPHVNAFSDQDLYLLQILATQAVFAIQRSRLLSAIQAISSLLMTAPRQTVLDFISAQACDLLNAGVCRIWMLEGDQLILKATSEGALDLEPVDPHNGLTGQAIRNNEAIASGDIRNDSRLSTEEIDHLPDAGSALIVPIIDSELHQPVGSINIYTENEDLRDFSDSEWEEKVLTILGQYSEMAVRQEAHQEALRISQEQQAIAETFAALGDISANLLHQLNNRVGTIPVRVQGILEKYPREVEDNPYLQNNLFEIKKSAQEAMNSVRDSLDLLRPIQVAPVDIQACLDQAIERIEMSPTLDLQVSGVDDLPRVRAGEQGLSLALQNLIENALNAMGDQGQIRVKGSAGNNFVFIEVDDSGPGIPLEVQRRIFDFDYSRGETENPNKLGFGLWWVKTLMSRFGGTVRVESDGRSGSRFILKLPIDEGSEDV